MVVVFFQCMTSQNVNKCKHPSCGMILLLLGDLCGFVFLCIKPNYFKNIVHVTCQLDKRHKCHKTCSCLLSTTSVTASTLASTTNVK